MAKTHVPFPLQERGPGDHVRYVDPAFGIGVNHWPKPSAAEVAYAEFQRRQAAQVTGTLQGDTPAAIRTSTPRAPAGPDSLESFMYEAEACEVTHMANGTPLKDYFIEQYARYDIGDIGMGMCRMRCNNALRAAIARKGKA